MLYAIYAFSCTHTYYDMALHLLTCLNNLGAYMPMQRDTHFNLNTLYVHEGEKIDLFFSISFKSLFCYNFNEK